MYRQHQRYLVGAPRKGSGRDIFHLQFLYTPPRSSLKINVSLESFFCKLTHIPPHRYCLGWNSSLESGICQPHQASNRDIHFPPKPSLSEEMQLLKRQPGWDYFCICSEITRTKWKGSGYGYPHLLKIVTWISIMQKTRIFLQTRWQTSPFLQKSLTLI